MGAKNRRTFIGLSLHEVSVTRIGVAGRAAANKK
jgi:hypothetical protein